MNRPLMRWTSTCIFCKQKFESDNYNYTYKCKDCKSKRRIKMYFETTKQCNKDWKEVVGYLYKDDSKFREDVHEFISLIGRSEWLEQEKDQDMKHQSTGLNVIINALQAQVESLRSLRIELKEDEQK